MLRQINPLEDGLTLRESMALVRMLEKYKQYKSQERHWEATGVGTAALILWRTYKQEPMKQTGFGALG